MLYSRLVTVWLVSALALIPTSAALPLQETPFTPHSAYLLLLLLVTGCTAVCAHCKRYTVLRTNFGWVMWGITLACFWAWYKQRSFV